MRQGVVAVIVRDQRWLVIQRSQFVRAPLAWCFPGGGIEDGESEEQALQRELREELALEVRPVRRLWQNVSPWKFDLRWWLAEVPFDAEPIPHPSEVAVARWLAPREIRALPELLSSNHAFLDAWERGEFQLADG